MIVHVMRISTVFANMMAASSFALAVTIAAAGITEKTNAGCYGCLHTGTAIKGTQATAAAMQPRGMQMAFGTGKMAALVE